MKLRTWVVVLAATMPGTACAEAPNETSSPAAGTLRVVPIERMSVPRAAHQATLLASGQVLLTGGCAGECDSTHRSAERYDPSTRSFHSLDPMAVARNSHAAVALPDGRVLLVGGWEDRRATASAELFDPAVGNFSAAQEMAHARAVPVATLLDDSRVLISGGQTSALQPLASVELFDPATSGFVASGSMATPRIGHAAVALLDGRVLVTGGLPERHGQTLRSAEIYDPEDGTFVATGDMAFARMKHAAVRLADGKVLIIGGSDEGPRRDRYRSTELFDPATGTFEPGPDMQQQRYKLPDAVIVLPSGEVLVAGGARQPELLPPGAQQFVPIAGEFDGPQEFATATLLGNGEVLVLGGYDEEINTSDRAWLITREP